MGLCLDELCQSQIACGWTVVDLGSELGRYCIFAGMFTTTCETRVSRQSYDVTAFLLVCLAPSDFDMDKSSVLGLAELLFQVLLIPWQTRRL